MRVSQEAVFSAEWQLRSDGWLLAGTGRIRLPVGATPALVRLCAGTEGLAVRRPGAGVEEVGAGRCELVTLLPGEAGEVEVSAPARRPVLVPAVQLLPLEALRPGGRLASAYMVPQVAHVAGYAGAFWRTDLVVMNPTSRPLRIAATFLPSGRANVEARSAAENVAPGQVVLVPDVLAMAAFEGKGTVGAMLVRSEEPTETCAGGACDFLVLARTYNSSAAPGAWRTAEWLPGVPASEALRQGDRATFSHLTSTDRVGATIGFASWSAAPVRAQVSVFGSAGEPLGARSLDVPPFGHARVPVRENVADGRVVVEVTQGGPTALVVPYAAMVDHETGFPVYVLPDALPPHPLPGGWAPPFPRPEAAR